MVDDSWQRVCCAVRAGSATVVMPQAATAVINYMDW